MASRRLLLASLLPAALAGCGFRLQGSRPLPEPLQRVYLDSQQPYSVDEPPVETSLRTRLRRRGAVVTGDRGDANAVLTITDLREESNVLSVNTRGRAIDFRVEGVPNRELRDLVRASFSGIGVGYYPNSTFIHVDVREREGQWIDYAGPGQDACYSPDVRGDFLSGRAETLSYAQAQARGCKGHTHPSTTTEPVAPSSSDADDEHGGTRVAELDEA